MTDYNGNLYMQNSIVSDVGNGYAVTVQSNHGNADTFYNNDFVNNLHGLYENNANAGAAVTNNIFISTGGSEIVVSTNSGGQILADYNTFKTTPTASADLILGTHNKTSTCAAEFTNCTVGSEDFHLLRSEEHTSE